MATRTLTADQFINTYVDAVYADDNDHLIVEWEKLPQKEYVERLAGYVLEGNGKPINYTINEDASVTINQTLLG